MAVPALLLALKGIPAAIKSLSDAQKVGLAAGGLKTLGGLAQAAFSGQRKAEKDLRKQIEAIPSYQKSQGILDYYEQAKQRYGVSPTQTAAYKRQMANIQRSGATALAGAGGARGRMAAASTIARSLSDAAQGAEVAAEQEQSRRFGQLGSAAQMLRGEEAMQQQRELMKQEQRIRQAAAKAAGRAATQRTGISNIFGGIGDVGKSLLSRPYGQYSQDYYGG